MLRLIGRLQTTQAPRMPAAAGKLCNGQAFKAGTQEKPVAKKSGQL
jgi:hypothetical protein